MINHYISKSFVLACCLAMVPLIVSAAQTGLPQGTFSGQGVWDAIDGSEGTYETSYTIDGSRLEMSYTYDREGNPEAGHHELQIEGRTGGRFELVDEDGNAAGQGFCRADTCLLKYTFPGGSVEQSLRLEGDKLISVGMKNVRGFEIHWVETLTRK